MSARLARTQHVPHDVPFHHRHLGFAAIGRPDVLLPEGEHGGDGAAPAGAPAPTGDPAPAPAPPPAAPPAAGAEWDGKVESLPEPVQKMIRELRQENGTRRTALNAAEQQQQDIVRAFAKAAGIPLPDDAPDPDKLTEQLTATQAQARQAAVELAVYKAAGTHKGDPNALLDSRAFLAKVSDLDPAANDFAAQVDAAVKQAVTDNPKLKTVQAAGASGAEFTGGPGDGAPRTPKPLDQAVAAHYGG